MKTLAKRQEHFDSYSTPYSFNSCFDTSVSFSEPEGLIVNSLLPLFFCFCLLLHGRCTGEGFYSTLKLNLLLGVCTVTFLVTVKHPLGSWSLFGFSALMLFPWSSWNVTSGAGNQQFASHCRVTPRSRPETTESLGSETAPTKTTIKRGMTSLFYFYPWFLSDRRLIPRSRVI